MELFIIETFPSSGYPDIPTVYAYYSEAEKASHGKHCESWTPFGHRPETAPFSVGKEREFIAKRYPLLVVIHGGPTGVSRATPYSSSCQTTAGIASARSCCVKRASTSSLGRSRASSETMWVSSSQSQRGASADIVGPVHRPAGMAVAHIGPGVGR